MNQKDSHRAFVHWVVSKSSMTLILKKTIREEELFCQSLVVWDLTSVGEEKNTSYKSVETFP